MYLFDNIMPQCEMINVIKMIYKTTSWVQQSNLTNKHWKTIHALPENTFLFHIYTWKSQLLSNIPKILGHRSRCIFQSGFKGQMQIGQMDIQTSYYYS